MTAGVIPWSLADCRRLKWRVTYDWNGQKIFVDLSIEIEDDQDLLLGLLLRREGRVALLPQELAGSEERLRVLELPTLERMTSIIENFVMKAVDDTTTGLYFKLSISVPSLI